MALVIENRTNEQLCVNVLVNSESNTFNAVVVNPGDRFYDYFYMFPCHIVIQKVEPEYYVKPKK